MKTEDIIAEVLENAGREELLRLQALITEKMAEQESLLEEEKGGPGSGHHGHTGRPGKQGGSAPGDAAGSLGERAHMMTREEFGKESGWWRGGFERESPYATDDEEIANLYRQNALIEAGGHGFGVRGSVDPVLYDPQKELDLEGLGTAVNVYELVSTLRDKGVAIPEMERPYWAENFAQKIGLEPYQASEYMATWRFLEMPEVGRRLIDAGFDGIRFRDVTRGKSHSAILKLDNRLLSHRRLIEQAIQEGKDVPVAVLEEYGMRKEKAASGSANLPIADRDRAWDADAAVGRIRKWAEAEDKPNAKYRQGFFWYDSKVPDNFGSFKLPFADVVNGTLTAIPRGIFAVAGVLRGARGGVAIPEKDQTAIKSRVAGYYARMRKKFDDDSLVAPWKTEEKEHSPEKCMSCEKPPTVVVLWANGKARAWFCDECLEQWSGENPGEINEEHKLEEDEDPRDWHPKPPGLKEESLHKDSKEPDGSGLTDEQMRARILHESEVVQEELSPVEEEQQVELEELESQQKRMRCPACGFVEEDFRPNLRCPECGDAILEEVRKSTSVEELAESTLHRSFTVLADGLFALGYMSRDERIALSSVIGDTLDRFGELFQEKWAEERGLNPDISKEDVISLLASVFKEVLAESGKPSHSLKDRFGEVRVVAQTIMQALRSKNKSALSAWKDSAGVGHYVALCSAELEDLEEETVETRAMDYSMALSRRHGFRPLLTVTHAPWARVGKNTWELRLGKFWLEGGVFDETWLARKTFQAIQEDREGDLRISIAFLYLPAWRSEGGRYERLFRYASGITRNPALPITAIQVRGGVDNGD